MDSGKTHDLSTPDKIARVAEVIYEKNFKKELEKEHNGEFVVIDVLTSEAYPRRISREST